MPRTGNRRCRLHYLVISVATLAGIRSPLQRADASSKRRQPTDTWLDHREDLHIASDRVQRGIIPSLAQHPLSQTGISFFAAADRCARLRLAASQSPIKLPISTPCLGARPAPGDVTETQTWGFATTPPESGETDQQSGWRRC